MKKKIFKNIRTNDTVNAHLIKSSCSGLSRCRSCCMGGECCNWVCSITEEGVSSFCDTHSVFAKSDIHKKHNFSKFDINADQMKAIESVKRAMKKAKSLGLVFYGKSESLVAYTKEADNYVRQEFKTIGDSDATGFSEIPYVSLGGCILDSGADDYPCFRNQHDNDMYLLESGNE
ncbi:MAG: hypothetical protein ACRDD8_06200 [Bacteroidales bacterium]